MSDLRVGLADSEQLQRLVCELTAGLARSRVCQETAASRLRKHVADLRGAVVHLLRQLGHLASTPETVDVCGGQAGVDSVSAPSATGPRIFRQGFPELVATRVERGDYRRVVRVEPRGQLPAQRVPR